MYANLNIPKQKSSNRYSVIQFKYIRVPDVHSLKVVTPTVSTQENAKISDFVISKESQMVNARKVLARANPHF